jgi:hypothetical protein
MSVNRLLRAGGHEGRGAMPGGGRAHFPGIASLAQRGSKPYAFSHKESNPKADRKR